MKEVLLALNQQPIAVYPIYIDITGSVTAGLLLSQIMYWNAKMKGKEFYKNDTEYMEETRLTQSEFKTAKKIVSGLSFLKIERKGAPYRTYYSVDHDELFVVLQRFSSLFTYELGSRLPTSKRGVNLRTIIGTENTQEITTENTTSDFVETSSTPFLSDADEIEDIEQQIYASKVTQKKERKSVAPKKKESDNPTPIREMFEIYSDQYAKMNGGEKPEFMPKYCQPMKKLYSILEARQAQSGIVPLDKLQPWRDFIEMWGKFLQDHPKETYFTANFNPATFYSQFNTIVAKLRNQPKTTAQKWEQFYRENTTG